MLLMDFPISMHQNMGGKSTSHAIQFSSSQTVCSETTALHHCVAFAFLWILVQLIDSHESAKAENCFSSPRVSKQRRIREVWSLIYIVTNIRWLYSLNFFPYSSGPSPKLYCTLGLLQKSLELARAHGLATVSKYLWKLISLYTGENFGQYDCCMKRKMS